MKSKAIYILIGGGCHHGDINNILVKDIQNILLANGKEHYNLLFIPFAKAKEYWVSGVKKYSDSFFKSLVESGKVKITIADPDNNLSEQVLMSDIIFISGGNEETFKETVRDFPKKLSDKIIIATSAGVNVLSEKYFSNMRKRIEDGLSIFAHNTICHFSTQNIGDALSLAEKNDYPVILIPEDNYVTIVN